jgi:nicotinamidase-related amidase
MPVLVADTSALLLIDFQTRLMPAIEGAPATISAARRLVDAAGLLGVPVMLTEQNPARLGPTIADLQPVDRATVVGKATFDALRDPGVRARLSDRPDVIVAGWEAHVCVLQTVLGLLDAGRRPYVVCDAVGSRGTESREAALRRMERHGAEIVTSEMVVFEWLGGADHPRFREVLAVVK